MSLPRHEPAICCTARGRAYAAQLRQAAALRLGPGAARPLTAPPPLRRRGRYVRQAGLRLLGPELPRGPADHRALRGGQRHAVGADVGVELELEAVLVEAAVGAGVCL